jgi:hypothetical protein
VIASRHADDALWAEVLNLGGSDVLEKPFTLEHVERVIGLDFMPSPQARLLPSTQGEPDSYG